MSDVWNNENFVAGWNQNYGLLMELAPTRPKLIFPWLQENMGSFEGKRLLDLGCGNGNLIRFFKEKNFQQWTGVDAGEVVLRSAASDLYADQRIKFVHADICAPLTDLHGHFDVVQSFFVMEEIPLSMTKNYWQNVHDCLVPQGEAYVVCNHPAKALFYDLKATLLQAPNEKYPDHRGYFDREGTGYVLEILNKQKGESLMANYYHKTMGDIVQGGLQAGLRLTGLEEVPKGVISFEQWQTHQPKQGDSLSLLMLKFVRD